jgi:hypothetical protein
VQVIKVYENGNEVLTLEHTITRESTGPGNYEIVF